MLERTQREDHRPWGFYRVLEDTPGHKVKRIDIHPGKRLSLQRHRRRSEHWTVVEGEALVTVGGEYRLLRPGDSVDIDSGHCSIGLGTRDQSLWCSSRCSAATISARTTSSDSKTISGALESSALRGLA